MRGEHTYMYIRPFEHLRAQGRAEIEALGEQRAEISRRSRDKRIRAGSLKTDCEKRLKATKLTEITDCLRHSNFRTERAFSPEARPKNRC